MGEVEYQLYTQSIELAMISERMPYSPFEEHMIHPWQILDTTMVFVYECAHSFRGLDSKWDIKINLKHVHILFHKLFSGN